VVEFPGWGDGFGHGRMNYKDTEPRLFFKIDLLTDFAAIVYQILQTGDTFPHGWYFRPSL
jgi:hypothetical protein